MYYVLMLQIKVTLGTQFMSHTEFGEWTAIIASMIGHTLHMVQLVTARSKEIKNN